MDENNYGKDLIFKLALDASDFGKEIKSFLSLVDKDNKEKKNKDKKDNKQHEEEKKKNREAFAKGLTHIKNEFIKSLANTFKEAWSELNSIVNYSTMTDSNIRDLKLGYGFSSSQAYGFDKALSVTGIDSMEDLMWANSTQLEQFKKAFDKYSTYYQTTMTEDYVAKQIEFQSEMEMFKQDLQNSVISFFMDNKDVIMQFMDITINFANFAIDALESIINLLNRDGLRSEAQAKSDARAIISSYTNTSTNNTINTTNNFTGVSEADKTWLSNSVQLAYKQSITMLNNS